MNLPRLVIAAPASGHGKTTVATGLMAALRRAGHTVSGHKVGPDYIDTGYHSLATGRPGRNLDPHLVGEDRLVPLLLHGAGSGAHTPGARGADIAIIEGAMGLHDGQIGGDGFASTAHVARVTQTPVVLVVDVSHASRSIAATVHGMVTWDPAVRVVGVILNKAGSQRHAGEVIRAMESTGLPVLGTLLRDDGIVAPSRHLGLIPADERDDAVAAVDRLAERIAAAVDLEPVVRLASAAPDLDASPWSPVVEVPYSVVEVPTKSASKPPVVAVGSARPSRPLIAVAGGRAFTFRYAETTELLEATGCEIVTFDPLADESLPDGATGLYLGGGFPEMHASALSANEPLRAQLRAAVEGGLPTVAECAGLLYLCRSVDGAPMVGALAADARMAPRLTLAYRTAVAPADHLLAPAGTRVTGHEFHRTTVDPAGDAAWVTQAGPMGFASSTLNASYLHVHWAGHPNLAQRFAAAAGGFEARTSGSHLNQRSRPAEVEEPAMPASKPRPANPLRHHGDAELGEGLVDLAVNVFDGPRPAWLDDALRASLDDIGHYPDPGEAERAIARRHGRQPEDVLATAGAAEAFGLIARLRHWKRPAVVHPQFTEPDVALTTAGHPPEHVILNAADGFTLDPAAVPEDADLVVVGNPTNPTSVLHTEASIRALLRPGRTLVVDEAFMDAVPGEIHSLAGSRLPGLIVVRSLTKLWSIPGVRAGYLLAEPATVGALRDLQPPWSAGSPALAAMVACASEEARAEQDTRAKRLERDRATLLAGLTDLGIAVAGRPTAPFVLAKAGPGVHTRLRDAGYAVRRCDTFPGLNDTWVRIAVRPADVTAKLLTALASSMR